MDKKEVTEVILLDLSSAFDTIDHGLMLDFLECDFSVIGPVRDWIAPYLLNRRQHIVIWKVYLTPSVPQGSCLNSVLFLLYASSLFRIVSKHLPDTHGYADEACYISRLNQTLGQTCNKLEWGEFRITLLRFVPEWFLIIDDKLWQNTVLDNWFKSYQNITSLAVTVGKSTVMHREYTRNLGPWFDNHVAM